MRCARVRLNLSLYVSHSRGGGRDIVPGTGECAQVLAACMRWPPSETAHGKRYIRRCVSLRTAAGPCPAQGMDDYVCVVCLPLLMLGGPVPGSLVALTEASAQTPKERSCHARVRDDGASVTPG